MSVTPNITGMVKASLRSTYCHSFTAAAGSRR
jgi:hypothetical protein